MESKVKIISILGYNVYSDTPAKIPIQGDKCRVINCSISPNNYSLASKDKLFNRALKQTDFLMLDGVYFALASILLLGKNIKRNQGPEVFKHFVERLNETSGRAFFLGSSETVLEKIRTKIVKEYPNITVATFSPPFKNEFSEEDNTKMVLAINNFKPDILFVGMTAPKQEKWSIKHKERVNANLIISIGNVFDWYAGTQTAIHPFFFKMRIAWLVRIILRPEILKRNLGNQMLFFWHLILMVFKMKKRPI